MKVFGLEVKAGAHTVRPEPRTVICFVLTPQRLAAYIVRPWPFILKARWLQAQEYLQLRVV